MSYFGLAQGPYYAADLPNQATFDVQTYRADFDGTLTLKYYVGTKLMGTKKHKMHRGQTMQFHADPMYVIKMILTQTKTTTFVGSLSHRIPKPARKPPTPKIKAALKPKRKV